MEERNLNSNIILYEAKTEADIRRFQAELRAYHARDIFPGEEDRGLYRQEVPGSLRPYSRAPAGRQDPVPKAREG